MKIRPATDDDWSAIWPFFRRIVAAGETYSYPADVTAEGGRQIWMMPPPAHVVVAVEDDGAVIGTAKVHANQTGPGAHVATASFMVDPAAAGHGVGRALGEHVLGWARDQGFRSMQFNAVVEVNRRAVGLWQSLGFEIVGTVPEAFHHRTDGYVGLHVMYRRL